MIELDGPGRPRANPVVRVLACVDNSVYANSVCDHAGWFASDPNIGVEVLHVVEASSSSAAESSITVNDRASVADPLIARAVWRLREEGVGPITSTSMTGSFVESAVQHDADMIVMGKRGNVSQTERRRLGSSVDAMVRRTAKPVCLAPKYFLPIHRALVLLDADLTHRAAVEFILSDSRLSALPVDVVVSARADEDADAKVGWARSALSALGASVFSFEADGLDDAVAAYMQSRGADLVIVSRAVVAADPETRLGLIEDRGLWGTRIPVLIC